MVLDVDSFGTDEAISDNYNFASDFNSYLGRTVGGGTVYHLPGSMNYATRIRWFQKPLFTRTGANNSSVGSGEYLAYIDEYGKMYYSTDGGTAFTDISPNPGQMNANHPYSELVGPFSPGLTMIAADVANNIWTSIDGGVSWTNASTPGLMNIIHWFPRQVNGNYALYAARADNTANRIYYSEDFGVTWSNKTGDLNPYPYCDTVIAIIPIP
jgi:hypothetical protein